MKALIVDPAVHSMGGHHFNAVQRLQDEMRKLGVDAPCLGSANADGRVIRELACTPTFTRSVYGRSYAAGEFAGSVEEASRQLAQAMRRRPTPDLILLPCCDQVLAAAIARYLKSIRFGPRPHLLVWLLYGPHHLRATDHPEVAALKDESAKAFAALKAAAGDAGKLKVFCETAALAHFYRELTGLDVGVMPGPGLVAHARAKRSAAIRPIVSCIGFANQPKGYRLLPEAVRHVLQHHGEARFMIHGVVGGSDAEADRPIFHRLADMGPRVMVRQDVLTPQEYLAWLSQADLLLMPYDREVYRSRGSGVFSDARAIGIPVVATQGCAFAQPAFDEGWGVAMEEYSSIGLGSAILTALARLEDLDARASLAAHQAHDELGRILQATVDSAANSKPTGLAGIVRRWAAGSS
jgi:glycosyltransferase involved in cell wall biosynthesis